MPNDNEINKILDMPEPVQNPRSPQLGLYLVFVGMTIEGQCQESKQGGGWNDMVMHTNKYSMATFKVHTEFLKPETRFVQIVNRNSGRIEYEQYK